MKTETLRSDHESMPEKERLLRDLERTTDQREKKRIRRKLRELGHHGGLRAADKEKLLNIKIIVEKHWDGYIAYPLGIKGSVVGQGDSYEEALACVKSMIKGHIDTFGQEVIADESPVLEVFVAEAVVTSE